MTRILFLPDDETLVVADSPLDCEELALVVSANRWLPPAPYDRPLLMLLHENPRRPALRFMQVGRTVILSPAAPLVYAAADLPANLRLTPRQREVLRCLSEGLTTKEAALRLHTSRRTVLAHIADIKTRLGVTTMYEAIKRAAVLGLV